jgi:hypothetical protein
MDEGGLVTETRKKLLTIGCGLLLAACAAPANSPAADATLPSVSTTTSEGTPTEGDGPRTNERGNLETAFGEELPLVTSGGETVGTLAVDRIEVLSECPDDGNEYTDVPTPQHGQFIQLEIRAATGPATPGVTSDASIGSTNFEYIQGDGLTFGTDLGTFPAFSCLDPQFQSGALGPGQQFAGPLVLDVPDTDGILVYKPSGGWVPGEIGYEFQLGG